MRPLPHWLFRTVILYLVRIEGADCFGMPPRIGAILGQFSTCLPHNPQAVARLRGLDRSNRPAPLNVALAAYLPARIGHVASHRWLRPSENWRPASSQSSRPLCHFTAVLRPHFIPFFLREEVLHMTRVDNGV